MDGWSNGVLRGRESSSADLLGWAREKILILPPRVIVLLSEKGRDSHSDGWTDLTHGARSAKGGRGRGRVGLAQLVVNGRDKHISKTEVSAFGIAYFAISSLVKAFRYFTQVTFN